MIKKITKTFISFIPAVLIILFIIFITRLILLEREEGIKEEKTFCQEELGGKYFSGECYY